MTICGIVVTYLEEENKKREENCERLLHDKR